MTSAPSFRLADQSVNAASEHLPVVAQEHGELRSAINSLHRLTAQRFHSLKHLQLVAHRLNYNTSSCIQTFANLHAHLRVDRTFSKSGHVINNLSTNLTIG